MNQRRARLFYRLSLLMIVMSFLSFVVLIAALFILNLQGAFVCDEPNTAGICTLRDRFQAYRILITGSTTLIVVFIILASYFQQFFLVKKPKKKKESIKKVKEMFSKDQNLAVFEVEPEVTADAKAPDQTSKMAPSKRRPKKSKPRLTEYSIHSTQQDDDLEAIKQSVYSQPDQPLKLPKDLKDLDDDDSDYLASAHPADDHPPSSTTKDDQETADKDAASSDSKKGKETPEPSLPKKEESIDLTKVRVLAKDASTKSKPKKHHPSIDDTVKRKRRTQAHTKEDLSLIVAKRVHLDATQARHIIDDIFDLIKDALTNHEKVNILKFGTFSTKKLKARTMQVPSKKETETTIPAHHVVRFKSSPAFDTFLNEDDCTPPIDFDPITVTPKASPNAPSDTPTIKKATLVDAVSQQTGLNPAAVKAFIKAFISASQDTLARKDNVTLTNFGTFEPVYHKEKKMVVPATKEAKIIPGYYTVKFRPSKAFTSFLNEK